MGWAEVPVVDVTRHADDVDLAHQGGQLCDGPGLTEADKALQHRHVSRPAGSPLLVRMLQCDEVQVGAAELVDESCHRGPNMLLVHVC